MPNPAALPPDAPSPSPSPRPGAKRGRKPKSAPDKRQHLVACRLTDAEQAQLARGRGALTAGEWLRTLALARRLPRAIPAVNLAAYSALARAAGNLNRLTRHVNATGQLELAELSATLAEFRAALLGVGSEQQEKAKAEARALRGEGDEEDKEDEKEDEDNQGEATDPGEDAGEREAAP